jgi:hypothetical protein
MRLGTSLKTCFLASLAIGLGACASAPESASVIRTVFNPDLNGFRNVLVVSVTGQYATRASFERQLATELTRGNVTATAYYTVIGRNPQLTRDFLEDAIAARGFDAVVFTRLKGQEQEDLAPGRPVGPAFDLFFYDYAELSRDNAIREAAAHTFVTELYSAELRQKVWAIETLSTDKPTVEALIEEQVFTIAGQIQQDGMLGR